jgi:predicted HicB family RNase H-like nuclease
MKKYLLELPTELHSKAKSISALMEISLKDFIIKAIEQEIEFRELNGKFRKE